LLKKDVDRYRKMAALARAQLASIDLRLAAGSGKWNECLFRIRHARLKRMLSNILREKEAVAGEDAVLELIDDLRTIGEDEENWSDVSKEETDYIRFVLHGIRQSPPVKPESENKKRYSD